MIVQSHLPANSLLLQTYVLASTTLEWQDEDKKKKANEENQRNRKENRVFTGCWLQLSVVSSGEHLNGGLNQWAFLELSHWPPSVPFEDRDKQPTETGYGVGRTKPKGRPPSLTRGS